MSDFFENKLKALPTGRLEEVLSKAVSEATGQVFEATISAIAFGIMDGTYNITFKIKD